MTERMKTVEILQYRLKPGSGRNFHLIMATHSAPLHRAAGIDIVIFGNSLTDEESYFLIRAFDSPAHLRSSLAAFYASDAWRNGPRNAIIAQIDSSWASVLQLSDLSIAQIKTDALLVQI